MSADNENKYHRVDRSVPYIMVDTVLTSGFVHGVFHLNVGTQNIVQVGDELKIVNSETAHIRMTVPAVKALYEKLERLIPQLEKSLPPVSGPLN